MPYSVIPVGGAFKVVNASTGKVHAEHTTKEKAEAQVRLLRNVEHLDDPYYEVVERASGYEIVDKASGKPSKKKFGKEGKEGAEAEAARMNKKEKKAMENFAKRWKEGEESNMRSRALASAQG